MTEPTHRIHLDPIGGIAGDMFVAALADAFPTLIAGLLQELKNLPAPEGGIIRLLEHRDTVLTGRRFEVVEPERLDIHRHADPHAHHHALDDPDGKQAEHRHTKYSDIRRFLNEATLRENVRANALAMFTLLANAEASVHGINPEDVVFHEVGAWDSIVDFVAAAYMIDTLNPVHWTWGSLPMGSGRVRSAHGILPVPAPATAILLRGMPIIDDGIPGERVTPTGAAILKFLSTKAPQVPLETGTPLVIEASGNGFGQTQLPGISNVLRCLAYARYGTSQSSSTEELSVATFEIDDQTAEDIAVALDRIRKAPGVLDVFQVPVFGKKGRISTQVQILVRPEHVGALADLCFGETSTLGLRLSQVTRKALPRSTLSLQQPKVRVKLAERPNGEVSAKAELDDLADLRTGKSGRDQARRDAEGRAIDHWIQNERSSRSDD